MTTLPPKLLAPAARWAKARHAGLLALALAGCAFVDPDHPLPVDVCGFKYLTGLPCPTCGLTRATCHALRGHWAQSVTYHPAGVLMAAAMVGLMLWSTVEAAEGRPFGDALRRPLAMSLLGGGGAISLAFWIFRLTSGAS